MLVIGHTGFCERLVCDTGSIERLNEIKGRASEHYGEFQERSHGERLNISGLALGASADLRIGDRRLLEVRTVQIPLQHVLRFTRPRASDLYPSPTRLQKEKLSGLW